MSDRSAALSILCVDDNADVASMLEALVKSQPGMACAGCVHQPDRVLEEVRRAGPDVVLLDLSMPGVDTIDLIRSIARDHPGSRVLVYSGYDHPETLDDVIAAGAWGLVSKHGRLDELVEAIRRVGQGEVVLRDK